MKRIDISQLHMDPVAVIPKEWMLLTAGCEARGFNTMTASWGHMGAIWGHGGGLPTTVVYVRPQRYTKEFMDREALYTLCFFSEDYKKDLGYLGRNSGRDGDKLAHTSLTPVFGEGYTYFAEAKVVLVCRKLYRAPILEEGFLDRSIVEECYPNKDFHDMYIGQIVEVLVED